MNKKMIRLITLIIITIQVIVLAVNQEWGSVGGWVVAMVLCSDLLRNEFKGTRKLSYNKRRLARMPRPNRALTVSIQSSAKLIQSIVSTVFIHGMSVLTNINRARLQPANPLGEMPLRARQGACKHSGRKE